MKNPERRRSGLLLLAIALASGAMLPTRPALAGTHPSGHAPIGVMGDHTHAKDEVMFSYRYMRMGMNGLRDGDERISRSRVLDDYMVTPTSMDMEMHMFGAMVAPFDRVTLMLMVPYVLLEMEHRVGASGMMFTTKSEGLGDVRATALVDLWKRGGHRVHANLGISFPTGSITQDDRTPASGGAQVRLPYPMQIGSGTFDFLPGLTYLGHAGQASWGAQGRGEVRLNENHADYRQGNEYVLTAWAAWDWTDWLSTSLRTEWTHQLNHRGRDVVIQPGATVMVPTADKGRRAFQRLDFLLGVNFVIPVTPLAGLRFAIEAGVPAYQYLDGPGLETDWVTTFGVQYAFD